MAVPKFTPGANYVLTHEDGHGTGVGSIPAGTEVSIVDVVASGTPGVGVAADGGDVVLFSFPQETVITDENGSVLGKVTRTASLDAGTFASLFKKAAA